MMTKDEIQMLNEAIEVKKAAVKRAAKAETNETIKKMRKEEETQYNNLQMKVNTMETTK